MVLPGQPGDPPGMELEETEEPLGSCLTQRRTTGNPSGRAITDVVAQVAATVTVMWAWAPELLIKTLITSGLVFLSRFGLLSSSRKSARR